MPKLVTPKKDKRTPAHVHNRQYAMTNAREPGTPIDFPAEMEAAFQESNKREISRLAKRLPLPDYRGYPMFRRAAQ